MGGQTGWQSGEPAAARPAWGGFSSCALPPPVPCSEPLCDPLRSVLCNYKPRFDVLKTLVEREFPGLQVREDTEVGRCRSCAQEGPAC